MIKKFLFLLFLPGVLFGQGLTVPKQKALNDAVQLANHLSAELTSLGPHFVRFYNVALEYPKHPTRPVPQYLCNLDAKSYYYDEVLKSAPALGGSGSTFLSRVEALKESYSKIDATCKSIEIYFRLKDYETDSFKKFEEQLASIETQVRDYSNKLAALRTEVDRLTNTLQPHNESLPYHKANKIMRTQLAFERELLEGWSFNVFESVHAGWPVEKTQKHIVDDMPKIEKLKSTAITLQYPASSMMKSFVESIESLQQSKRAAVDGDTFEQQESDKHGNDSYFNLINYYNNAAISFYNNFVNMAQQNGYRGVYYVNYVPLFQIRKEVMKKNMEVTPYVEKQISELKVTPSTAPVTASVFASLTNYVDFINEGARQFDNIMNSMRNLNGSASHGKASLVNEKRVIIDYYYKNFELPVTLYQQTVVQTKVLPGPYQKTLLERAEILYSILTELNQWNNLLLADAASKQLAKDSLNHVYSVIGRYKELVAAFDDQKEKLYKDVRKVFESYKPVNAKSSWYVSGKAMLSLADEDLKALLATRQHVFADSAIQPATDGIEKMSRELIANEYTNLKGIEKLGRYNGNCPYTPYENMAEYSKSLAKRIGEIDGHLKSDYYRHPYNELVHSYNQSIVYAYNQFTELSKVPLLKTVEQLQSFQIIAPEKPAPKKVVEPAKLSEVEVYVPETYTPETVEPTIVQEQAANGKSEKSKRKKKGEVAVVSAQPTAGGVVHDTVRITDIIRIETIRQDTVYVEKRDTVYVSTPGESFMSMEGYATNNMVLLLDVSGSMNNPDKLPLLKKSVLLLLKMMRPEDEVSIVIFSGKAKVALQPISFKEEEKIRRVIEQLKSEGTTDGNAGLKLAYDVADENYIRAGNNRIILATDGEFPVSAETFDLVKKFSGEDIFISVFNFGKTTQSAKNLQRLTSLGKGNYEFITRENVDSKLVKEAKAKRRK